MDCGRFAVDFINPLFASRASASGGPRIPSGPLYADRFIRTINPNILSWSEPTQTEIPTRAQIAYQRTLSETMLGVDLTAHPSVFSSPMRLASPLALSPVRAHAVAEPRLTISSPGCHRVLDAPGIVGGRRGLSRPLTILDERTVIVALANKVYAHNTITARTQELCAIIRREGEDEFEAERTLSHITVLNPDIGEFVASDTTGRIYRMQAEHDVLEEPEGDGDAIVDLVATDRSTLFVGTETGRILLKDARDFTRTNGFHVSQRVSVLSLCKDAPLFAVGSENSVRIFDIRRIGDPVAARNYAGLGPVSALAWGTHSLSKRLFAAFGGESPVITVNDTQGSLQQRCARKTFGVVRSIFPTCTEAFITIRKHPEGKYAVVWEYSPDKVSETLSCTQIGQAFGGHPRGMFSSPTSAVMGKGEGFIVTAFSEQTVLVLAPLQKRVAQTEQKILDRSGGPYCLR